MAAFDSSLNDPYISNLLLPSSSLRRAPPRSSNMSSPSVSNLIQFLESVPPPITLLLVELAPFISLLRWATEVVSWKSHWTDSWLVLAGLWGICLSTHVVLRYLLPLTLLLPPLLPYLPLRRARLSEPPPTTEQSLSLALSEITIIHSHMPTFPALPDMPFHIALRLSALLFIPYMIVTYFVPIPILIGIAGTLLFTYRAPWARTLRTVLWRSAYIRRFSLRVWSHLTGVTSPALISSTVQSTGTDPKVPQEPAPASRPIRFLFTILECQRWWMGLDWTAALLPGERPSWCSGSQQAVPPPSTFSLPPPTSIYLPTPNGMRSRRVATWRWEESEWGVWINKEGTGGKRVEKKPPGAEDEEGGSRIASKAASMLRERTASIGSRAEMSPTKDNQDVIPTLGVGPGLEGDGDDEVATDSDGWVYGDNKWEGAGPKGGIGKYTRYRRWTRVAVLEEKVEEVEPDEVDNVDAGEEVDSGTVDVPHEEGRESKPELPRTIKNSDRESGDHEDGRSNLRQRLKATVQGTSNPS